MASNNLLTHRNGQPINILYWNACNLIKKYTEFLNLLEDKQIHIGLVSETWLSFKNKTEYSKNYIIHRMDRNERNNQQPTRGGGVAIVIRKDIQHELLPALNSLKLIESIGVEIKTTTGRIKLYSTYFPGISSPYVKSICLQLTGNCNSQTIKSLFRNDVQKLCNFNDRTIIYEI